MRTLFGAVLVFLIMLPLSLSAQEAEEREGAIQAVGLFLGGTTKFKDGSEETSFTLAGEYEYIGQNWGPWGVAGVVEIIFAHDLEYIIMPMAYYHPIDEAFIRAGVGLEVGSKNEEGRDAHLILRVGVGYSFEVGEGILLVPSFDIDGIRSDPAMAYGLVLAKEW